MCGASDIILALSLVFSLALLCGPLLLAPRCTSDAAQRELLAAELALAGAGLAMWAGWAAAATALASDPPTAKLPAAPARTAMWAIGWCQAGLFSGSVALACLGCSRRQRQPPSDGFGDSSPAGHAVQQAAQQEDGKAAVQCGKTGSGSATLAVHAATAAWHGWPTPAAVTEEGVGDRERKEAKETR